MSYSQNITNKADAGRLGAAFALFPLFSFFFFYLYFYFIGLRVSNVPTLWVITYLIELEGRCILRRP
jgi:hypothetical protein